MKIKRRPLIITVCILAGILFVAGVTAAATTNYGTKDDPLVTLSYINQTVTPAVNEEIKRLSRKPKAPPRPNTTRSSRSTSSRCRLSLLTRAPRKARLSSSSRSPKVRP